MGATGGREVGKQGLAEALLCTELVLSLSKSPQEDLKAPCNSSGSLRGSVPLWLFTVLGWPSGQVVYLCDQ